MIQMRTICALPLGKDETAHSQIDKVEVTGSILVAPTTDNHSRRLPSNFSLIVDGRATSRGRRFRLRRAVLRCTAVTIRYLNPVKHKKCDDLSLGLCQRKQGEPASLAQSRVDNARLEETTLANSTRIGFVTARARTPHGNS